MTRLSHRPQSLCLSLLLALAVFSLPGSQFIPRASGQIGTTTRKKKKETTPKPSPEAAAKLSGMFADTAATIALLNAEGPQLPKSFDTGKFTITAFVQGGWPLVIQYELEKDGVAVITLAAATDHGRETFVKELPGEGERLTRRLEIPERFGNQLAPGLITIESFAHPAGEKRHANFQLYGIGLGVKGVTFGTSAGLRGLELLPEPPAGQVVPASYGLQLPDVFSRVKLFQSDVIIGPTFDTDTINTSRGNKITYRFQPRETFGMWAADFRAVTKQTNSAGIVVRQTTKRVRTDQFNEEIGPREVVKDWDGRDDRGEISLGEYRLTIRAWWSEVGGGKAVIRNADKNIFIK